MNKEKIEITKEQFFKKLKALGWLTLYTSIVSVADLGITYLEVFNLPPTANLAIGYALQQISHICKKLKQNNE